ISETVDCVVATKAIPRAGVAEGRVAGVHQVAHGKRGGETVISLDLEMSMAAPEPHDRVLLSGDPPLDVLVQGGTQGDRGTVRAAVNAIPKVLGGPACLRSLYDLPLFGVLI